MNILYIFVMLALVSIMGCSPKVGEIKVAPADYDKIKNGKPTVVETRVFIKKSSVCDYTNKSNEAAAEIAIASFLINFAVDKAEESIKKEAAYLNAEVSVSGSALLSLPAESFWPSPNVLSNYATMRKVAIDNAGVEAGFDFSDVHPGIKSDDARLIAAVKAAKDEAGERFDKTTFSVTSDPGESLCVLAITGEYSSSISDSRIFYDYQQATGAQSGPIGNYRMAIPGVDANEAPKPFENLNQDPVFVAEIQIIPAGKKDTVQYFVVPKNIFYPNPLHKHTLGGLERTITIVLTLGDRTPTIAIERMKSGNSYNSKLLSTRFTSFEAPKEKAFQSVQIRVGEGTDSMPTSDLLTAVAGKKADIAKALIEKATEVLAEEDEKKK